jgi:hypothetical protein
MRPSSKPANPESPRLRSRPAVNRNGGQELGTMTRIVVGLLGTLFIAIGLAWAIGPVRLLVSLVAVPVTWAIITVVALTVWATIALHSG